MGNKKKSRVDGQTPNDPMFGAEDVQQVLGLEAGAFQMWMNRKTIPFTTVKQGRRTYRRFTRSQFAFVATMVALYRAGLEPTVAKRATVAIVEILRRLHVPRLAAQEALSYGLSPDDAQSVADVWASLRAEGAEGRFAVVYEASDGPHALLHKSGDTLETVFGFGHRGPFFGRSGHDKKFGACIVIDLAKVLASTDSAIQAVMARSNK